MVEEITLRKLTTGEEIHMDMVTSPGFILKEVYWSPIIGTHSTYKYSGQVGVSVAATNLGTRDIRVEGWIVSQGENDMTLRKNTLNRFVNPQEPLELRYSTYRIEFLPDCTIQYATKWEENNDAISKFQILGTAHDPMFAEISETRLEFATTTAEFHFPLVLSPALPYGGVVFGARTPSLIAAAVNRGSVPTGMQIVFKAKGSLENPKLINVLTQESLMINKSLLPGEEIQINTSVGHKSIRGRVGSEPSQNYFAYLDLDSVWLQLAVGKNLFRYDADSGLENLDVFVRFSNKFSEVQECY